jgi:hypothetical protein
MSLASKLQLKASETLTVVNAPGGLDADLPAPRAGDGLLVFVTTADDLRKQRQAIVSSARGDRSTWVAYPKAGKLGTDLNRDSLAASFAGTGVRPVRQIAIDDTWSALRFRPGSR